MACLVIFGPERFPIDEFLHQELRVRFCPDAGPGPRIVVEMRTYERTMTKDGYEETPISSGPDGWHQEKSIPLYLTTDKPKEAL